MPLRYAIPLVAILGIILWPTRALGQTAWEYGGFVDSLATVYPRKPNPADARTSANGYFQLWARASFGNRFSWRGAWDFRIDTHRDIDRRRWLDLSQRGLRQPAGSLRELYVDAKLGHFDLRLGKQEIRWGRADGFNPTDNLVPYDYLDVFSEQRLAVPAVKADAYAGKARLETAWIPFYTPTRVPLLGQRWFPRLPSSVNFAVGPGGESIAIDLAYREGTVALPARTFRNGQWGVRWNQLVPRAEFSISYFDGLDDLAFFHTSAILLPSAFATPRYLVALNRKYYRVKVAGADFASELGGFGIRGELAYFNQTDPNKRDHLLFVVGLDRTWGNWFAILQYAGQKVSGALNNAAVFPDLGLRSTLMFRLERNLGPSRSLEIKGAIRLRDGDFILQPVYSVSISNRWKLKVGATLFGGPLSGFLGQYRDNGHLNLQLRYSF